MVIVNEIVGELIVCGFEVDWIDNGCEGMMWVMSVLYDVIMFDWMLLGVDGFVILIVMCMVGIDMLVLMLSVFGDVDEWICGLCVGGDDYLMKLFDLGELSVCIEVLLCCW